MKAEEEETTWRVRRRGKGEGGKGEDEQVRGRVKVWLHSPAFLLPPSRRLCYRCSNSLATPSSLLQHEAPLSRLQRRPSSSRVSL